VKSRLAEGRTSVGSWLSFPFLPLAEMLARPPFEWLAIDLEHTVIDLGDVLPLVMVIERSGLSPLVRVGDADPLMIKRVMDTGAHGIIAADVRGVEHAQAIVDAVYYPPKGRRGAGLGRAHAYGLGFDDYRDWLEREAVVVVQIEHIDAVERLDQILKVEGVDAFMVGPYDLSASLGRPGDFESPRFLEAMAQVRTRMANASVPGGIHIVHADVDALETRIGEGYRFIAYGDDMLFFAEVADKVASDLSEHLHG
jgi:2-dehydro-3-deoxyglucarate aldolase